MSQQSKGDPRGYIERLVASTVKSHLGALSPAETRLVEVAAKMGIANFLPLAMAESGANWSAGSPIPDRVIARASQMLIVSAARMESELQGLRDAIEGNAAASTRSATPSSKPSASEPLPHAPPA